MKIKIDPTLFYSEANFSSSLVRDLTDKEKEEVLYKMKEFKEQKEKWLYEFLKNREK